MYELLGLLGSVVIISSFVVNGEGRVRIINTIGSCIFLVYAILMGLYSLILLNLVSITINVVKIIKLRKEGKH